MLEEALQSAMKVAQEISHHQALNGDPSIKLSYNHYLKQWQAEAAWNSGVIARGEPDPDPELAVIYLERNMERMDSYLSACADSRETPELPTSIAIL
jgi:hypothetical protein